MIKFFCSIKIYDKKEFLQNAINYLRLYRFKSGIEKNSEEEENGTRPRLWKSFYVLYVWKCGTGVKNYFQCDMCIAWEIESMKIFNVEIFLKNKQTLSLSHSKKSRRMLWGECMKKGKVHRSSCMSVSMCSHICLFSYVHIYETIIQRKT